MHETHSVGDILQRNHRANVANHWICGCMCVCLCKLNASNARIRWGQAKMVPPKHFRKQAHTSNHQVFCACARTKTICGSGAGAAINIIGGQFRNICSRYLRTHKHTTMKYIWGLMFDIVSDDPAESSLHTSFTFSSFDYWQQQQHQQQQPESQEQPASQKHIPASRASDTCDDSTDSAKLSTRRVIQSDRLHISTYTHPNSGVRVVHV